MLGIPYGQTLTYGDVAAKLNVPAQVVGQACGQNPIAIVIPCHRIVGTNWLGGYSSELGLSAKEYLLDLERGQGRLF
jgi:methylated-DNA-[protein]-cysteine S-methyltransferase